MKKFNFKFEKILKLRLHREEEEKEKLKELLNILNQETNKLRLLEVEYKNKSEELVELNKKGMFFIEELITYYNYLQKLKGEVDAQKKRVEEADKHVKIQQENLLKAMRERKIMEKLKEKHAATHKLTQLANEQKILDEMGLIRRAIT